MVDSPNSIEEKNFEHTSDSLFDLGPTFRHSSILSVSPSPASQTKSNRNLASFNIFIHIHIDHNFLVICVLFDFSPSRLSLLPNYCHHHRVSSIPIDLPITSPLCSLLFCSTLSLSMTGNLSSMGRWAISSTSTLS